MAMDKKIVKQAYDIAKLRDRSIKETKETIYFDNASRDHYGK